MSRWSRKLTGSATYQEKHNYSSPLWNSRPPAAALQLSVQAAVWEQRQIIDLWEICCFIGWDVFSPPRFWHGIFVMHVYFSWRLCKGQMYVPWHGARMDTNYLYCGKSVGIQVYESLLRSARLPNCWTLFSVDVLNFPFRKSFSKTCSV